MIVCSIPRCGATKYCLDLENQTGLKFIGELNPMYLAINHKQEHHETQFQPSYTADEFVGYIHSTENYIALVNKASYLRIHDCDQVVLRKNMLNAFYSFANFLIKMHPLLDARIIINEVVFSIYDYKAVMAYLEKHPKPIVWYEEYFGIEDTNTPLLDKHKYSKTIKKAIHDAFETC